MKKNIFIMAIVCVLAFSVLARAADGPKLVGEKAIMELGGKKIAYLLNGGISSMRLSPDARKLLYFRRGAYKIKRADGKERTSEGLKPVLRDLKTGKDTPLPIPALYNEDYSAAWLSMTVFDPSSKTIIVPVGLDGNKNGRIDETSEQCVAGLYDIASGKLTKLKTQGKLIFPAYHPNGKTLIVMGAVGPKTLGDLFVRVSPAGKIKFRELTQTGLPRSICPTADLMVLLLFTEGQNPHPGNCVIYDLKADKVKAELTGQDQAESLMKHNPYWTADGRYIYHVLVKKEDRNGVKHRETLTRIYDVRSAQETGILSGLTPIGPGPGKTSMVLLRKKAAKPRTDSQIYLHVSDTKSPDGKLHPLGDKTIRPISTQGKWLLYIRTDDAGKEKACMAEIKLQ
jgi:hypothetical protein